MTDSEHTHDDNTDKIVQLQKSKIPTTSFKPSEQIVTQHPEEQTNASNKLKEKIECPATVFEQITHRKPLTLTQNVEPVNTSIFSNVLCPTSNSGYDTRQQQGAATSITTGLRYSTKKTPKSGKLISKINIRSRTVTGVSSRYPKKTTTRRKLLARKRKQRSNSTKSRLSKTSVISRISIVSRVKNSAYPQFNQITG